MGIFFIFPPILRKNVNIFGQNQENFRTLVEKQKSFMEMGSKFRSLVFKSDIYFTFFNHSSSDCHTDYTAFVLL